MELGERRPRVLQELHEVTLLWFMLRLPESKDKEYAESIKKMRYKQAGEKFRIDLRPKVFLKTMKLELMVLFVGVGVALCK